MALEKFLFSGSDGFAAEAPAAIQTSGGAGDAGKLVQTSADGKLDSSLINFSFIKRYFTADLATTPSDGNLDLATGGFLTVDGVVTTGSMRVLVKNQTSAAENGIYTPAAGAWSRVSDYDDAEEIVDGSAVAIGLGTDNADKVFIQVEQVSTVGSDAINFSNLGTSTIEAGDGLSYTGNTLNVNPGNGIKFISDNVSVEPADFAGAGLIDDGSDNMAIDWSTAFNDAKAIKAEDLASQANGEGASIIGIEDASAYFDATDVEGALEELAIADLGQSFTVGTGGVSKGDLVFISADDTVEAHDDLSLGEYGIGLAGSTESASGAVLVYSNDTVLAGALAGATAGAKYYWDGSALTTSIPSGSGSYVWRAGVAKNATDLYVDIEFVRKNA